MKKHNLSKKEKKASAEKRKMRKQKPGHLWHGLEK
jgi:hypothetical protein